MVGGGDWMVAYMLGVLKSYDLRLSEPPAIPFSYQLAPEISLCLRVIFRATCPIGNGLFQPCIQSLRLSHKVKIFHHFVTPSK